MYIMYSENFQFHQNRRSCSHPAESGTQEFSSGHPTAHRQTRRPPVLHERATAWHVSGGLISHLPPPPPVLWPPKPPFWQPNVLGKNSASWYSLVSSKQLLSSYSHPTKGSSFPGRCYDPSQMRVWWDLLL